MALLVVTTTIVEEGSSQYDLVTIITQIQDPATAANTRASASTQTSNDGAGGSDRNPTTVRSANEIITTELTVTKHISSYYVPSTQSTQSAQGQAINQGKSATKSKSASSSHPLLSQPPLMPLEQSSKQTSSLMSSLLSEVEYKSRSATSSRISPSTKTSLSVPVSPSTLNKGEPEGSEGLATGLVAAIAVGAILGVLLLLGAAVYCCLKRRIARRGTRLRASTLSGKDTPSREPGASSEWKPPVELPHQNVTASQAELENSLIFHPHPNHSALQSAPATPSSLSAYSSFALRDGAEMQGSSPCVSPAELFVMPAELPGVYKSHD